MIEAKISMVKNQLSRYLERVRRGESVRILDRDTPVALLVPVAAKATLDSDGDGEAALLAQMERKGLVRCAGGTLDPVLLEEEPAGRSAGVLQALLEDRDAR